MGDIKKMLHPGTVALIGASEKEGSIGRAIMDNLLKANVQLFPVNINNKKILGIESFSNIKNINKHIDLAIIATPADTVASVVEDCGKAGVDGVIVISSGFRETGQEGLEKENKLLKIKEKYGIRIMGPNCLGIFVSSLNLNTSFMKISPEQGKIAFISQSGAMGSSIIDWAASRHIGFSFFASMGSMVDIDFGDMIDYLGDTPDTRSIIIYMESMSNVRKFMSAARGFARNKPIIVIKAGRFNESRKASKSHTGAMAGEDSMYDAAFRRAGIVRLKEIEDIFNVVELLASARLPKGPSLGIITNSGGPGVLATDKLIELGGKLADLSDKTLQELNAFLPKFWSKGNPIDILGDADTERFGNTLKVCLENDEFDGALAILTPQQTVVPEEHAAVVSEIAKNSNKPVITAWMGGEEVAKAREVFTQNGIPTYETPESAIEAYQYLYKYSRNLKLLYETPAEMPMDKMPTVARPTTAVSKIKSRLKKIFGIKSEEKPKQEASQLDHYLQSTGKQVLKELIDKALKEGRTLLSEEEAKTFLKHYDIPFSPSTMAKDIDEALNIAATVGYPVALKISSPDISNKTDIGGIVAGIGSENELREEYHNMLSRIHEKLPDARIQGITIQRMLDKIDYELILGTKKDSNFGSVILFGQGGMAAELFRDFSIGLPPLNQTLARLLIEDTNASNMLRGFRNISPADQTQLEQIILSFSNMIIDFPDIVEMDINPLAISSGDVIALDARIIIEKIPEEIKNPYSHLIITPYPVRYNQHWQLTDGTNVLLRPIRSEDEPLEYEMLSTLSDQSRKLRFFVDIKDINHEMLTRFCNIDYDREMAIVAELGSDDERKIVGIGRLIIDHDFKAGEFAIVIHDKYQNMGLGQKLTDIILGIALEKGLEKVYATILPINYRFLHICKKLGFTVFPENAGIIRIELPLKHYKPVVKETPSV